MFLKCSISQMEHFSNGAFLKWSISQMEHFSNGAILKWSDSQMERFSNGAILKWSNSQMEQFSNGAIWGRHPMPYFKIPRTEKYGMRCATMIPIVCILCLCFEKVDDGILYNFYNFSDISFQLISTKRSLARYSSKTEKKKLTTTSTKNAKHNYKCFGR